MRSNSRLAVGSPTIRVVALLATTLLLAMAMAGAGIAGKRLLAADDRIVVAQSGFGHHHYTTIAEAVDAAADGDTIVVKPGRYVESLAIVGKDLTIRGEGDLERIIIELDPAGPIPEFDWGPYLEPDEEPPTAWAFLFADTKADLSNVSVVAPDDEETILVVGGGADVALTGIDVRSLGEVRGGINAVYWSHGASGSLRDSHVEGWVGLNGDSSVIVERNEMPATCLGVWEQGAEVVIRENVIHGCPYEKGIEIDRANTVLVELNDIWVEEADPGPPNDAWGGRKGISIFGPGAERVVVRDNQIHDSLIGVVVSSGAAAEIIGNQIADNEVGINTFNETNVITGNRITGSTAEGLLITGGSPTVRDNIVIDNGVGLALGGSSDPQLAGNTICDNGANVISAVADDPPDLAGNEVCAD